jgi:hypothetical protein
VLILEALQPARCDVVLDWRRGGVWGWFSGEAFAHLIVQLWVMSEMTILTPTNSRFYPAPVGILFVPELHALIAIEVDTCSRIVILGKFKKE